MAKGKWEKWTISIHAPRGGSDIMKAVTAVESTISIHAPRGGATEAYLQDRVSDFDFNPRSSWGERQRPRRCHADVAVISIHAPRGGSDFDELKKRDNVS